MKRSLLPAACFLVLAGSTAPASAGVFELDAQIQTGGMGGTGLFGDRQDEAFHAGASGFTYGVLVGVELLFIDGWVEHNQYYDGSRVNGTWTQFMLGFDLNFDIGETVGAKPGADGKGKGKGYTKGFGEVGVGLGFGVGTGQQVDPPLDNSELSDQGFVGHFHLDFGYRLNKVMSVGLHFPFEFGYLIRKAPLSMEDENFANDTSNHYGTMSAAALITMRANFSLTD